MNDYMLTVVGASGHRDIQVATVPNQPEQEQRWKPSA